MKSFLVKGFYLNLAKEIKSNLNRIELYLSYRYAEKDTICRDTLKRYISKVENFDTLDSSSYKLQS